MAVVAAEKAFIFCLDQSQSCCKYDENLVNNILPYRFVLDSVHSVSLLMLGIFHVIPPEASKGLFSPE